MDHCPSVSLEKLLKPLRSLVEITQTKEDSDHPDEAMSVVKELCVHISPAKAINCLTRVENAIINQRCGKNSKQLLKHTGSGVECHFLLIFFSDS